MSSKTVTATGKKAYKRLSREERADVEARLAQGERVEILAAELGCHFNTIYNIQRALRKADPFLPRGSAA